VLVSGSGSNLQALIDASADATYRIVVVLADRPGVRGLERAETAGIPTEVVSWVGGRDVATGVVCDVVESYGGAAMVLAGFMRILGGEAVRRFPNRILNVHPSLLPAFPGAHAVELALEHGVKVAGVTVHFVDEKVDHGPIVCQRVVEVQPDDGRAELHARMQAVEHEMFPEAVEAFAAGRLTVEGRKVVWS
jgi:phosphoribosylglycinamide formyltransferase-1